MLPAKGHTVQHALDLWSQHVDHSSMSLEIAGKGQSHCDTGQKNLTKVLLLSSVVKGTIGIHFHVKLLLCSHRFLSVL